MNNTAVKSKVIPFPDRDDISARKAAQFITSVWEDQPGKYFFLEARVIGGKPGRGKAFHRDRLDGVEAYIRDNQDKNLFWVPHGFDKRRRKKVYAPNPMWLHADLDGVDIEELRVKPTIAIESSPGRYVGLWKMDKPTSFDVSKRISYACAEDKGGWMTTKFLRFPFTVNRKLDRDSPTVKLLWDDGPEYTMATLNKALGPWANVSEQGMTMLRKKCKASDNKSDYRISIVNRLIREEFTDEQIFGLFGTDNPWAGDYSKLMADIVRIRQKPLPGMKTTKPSVDPGRGMTARQLQKEPEVELEWLLEGIFPEGTSILCGRPKAGKSLMAMHMALAVARGTNTLGIDCEKGDVLYIVLEGGKNQLRRRLKLFLGDGPKVRWPRNITFFTHFPRFDEGALKWIKRWLDETDKPRLIVVDTLAAVKARVGIQTTATDYDSVAPFTRLLEDYPGVGGVILAHTKKAGAEDPLDELSGTLGTAAAVNTINVIRRDGGKTLFYGRGHELEEFNKVVELQFPEWRILGDEGKVTTADNPLKILDQLHNARKALTPKEISKLANLDGDVVKTTLKRMLEKELVIKTGHGKYAVI